MSVYVSFDWKFDQQDDEHVQQIIQELEKMELQVISAQNESNGTNIPDSLIEAMKNAKYMVIIVTKHYQERVNSSDVFDQCRYECINAFKKQIPVLPIVLHVNMKDPNQWMDRFGAFLTDYPFLDFSHPEIFQNHPHILHSKCYTIQKILAHVSQGHGSIQEAILSMEFLEKDKENEFCSVHHHLLQFYDANCHKLLCSHCLQGTHNHDNHQLVPIKEMIHPVSKDATQLLEQIQKKCREWSQYHEFLVLQEMQLQKQKVRTERAIRKDFEQVTLFFSSVKFSFLNATSLDSSRSVPTRESRVNHRRRRVSKKGPSTQIN
jgi:hypothetical protein